MEIDINGNVYKVFTSNNTYRQGNYNIEFGQIIEYPAKVSVRIKDATNSYNIYTTDATQVDIVNEISAILDGNK